MNLLEYFKPVTTLIFDIDGVLTDGNVLAFENGEQVRLMNIKDGYALQLAVKKKYNLVVISGANGLGVKARLQKLGIIHIFLNVTDKSGHLDEFLREHGLTWAETLYMGDDIPDFRPMQKAGMACAPADASPEILQTARYISPYGGGKGCVRDVIEKLLRLHGNWEINTDIPSQ